MEKKKINVLWYSPHLRRVCFEILSRQWFVHFLEQEKYNCTLKTVFDTVYVKNEPQWLQKELICDLKNFKSLFVNTFFQYFLQ